LKSSFRTISTDGTQNRIAIFVRKSISDFETAIAITIAIKNKSGSIAIRFCSQNRILVSGKTDPWMFSQENHCQDMMMGAEAPIPPVMIPAADQKGRPAAAFISVFPDKRLPRRAVPRP
jgi:hypothetical protein